MDTLKNFRDLGGIRVSKDQALRHKALLRSALFSGLSDGDKSALVHEYNLKLVLDLRTEYEAGAYPDDRIDGVEYINLDIMGDLISRYAEKKFSKDMEIDEIIYELAVDYQRLITYGHASRAYKTFIEHILACDGAVLFHCYAGKDRTGIGAAILLALMGADDKTIMADYLKTNESMEKKREFDLEQARKSGKSEQELLFIELDTSVKEEIFQFVLDAANKECGSFKAYVMKYLEIDESVAQALKNKYLISLRDGES